MPHRFFTNGRLEVEPLTVELERFLGLVIQQMKLDVRYEIRAASPAAAGPGPGAGHGASPGNPEVHVVFHGRDDALLLERNAELLLTIEYLALRCLHLDPQAHDYVHFDCAEFRATRLAELKLSAQVAAQRVREMHQPFRMNPMSARERRVIHLTLQSEPGVRTGSEGDGDRRQVVIYPADSK
jgi:spoIIIJ-associated protein